MQTKIPNDHAAILAVLEINNNLTYHEIARLLRWHNPNKVSRRMPELFRLDKVITTGIKICPIAKSKCTTYSLKTTPQPR